MPDSNPWLTSPFAQAYFASTPNSSFASLRDGSPTSGGNNAPGGNTATDVAPVGNTNTAAGNNSGAMAPASTAAPGTQTYGGNNAVGTLPPAVLSPSRGVSAYPRNTMLGATSFMQTPYNENYFGGGAQQLTHGFMRDPMGPLTNNGSSPSPTGFMPRGVTSFAAGGMVTPTGGAVRPGSSVPEDEPQMGADAPMPMQGAQIDQEAKQMAQQNPQVMQHVMQLVTAAIRDGTITPDKLNLMVQLAKAAVANPNAYAQIRQFAIKNGLGTEQDIPQQYDPGLLYVLITIGNAMQNGGAAQLNPNTQGGSAPAGGNIKAGLLPEYEDGGMTGGKKHIALVHPNEYVVPADVVLYHGKKHMDKLVEQARTPKDGSSPQ